MNKEIIVIGGGAAGIMAALVAAKNKAQVILIEKNKNIGRKLAITGGGRCNLTNQAELPELIANIPGNGSFLYSAFQQFSSSQLINYCETELGVPLKIERGRRVFPVSDQAQEVVGGFNNALKAAGVRLMTSTKVTGISIDQNTQLKTIFLDSGQKLSTSTVIIATGGLSYPGTGSTGDGYRWAKDTGHTIIPTFPSLIPLETKEEWPKRLEGLSLINIQIDAYFEGKKFASEFGEMLFTSYGVSGPIILSLSRQIVPKVLASPDSVQLKIDLKPALKKEDLDVRVQRDFSQFTRKLFKNALDELLPQKLIPVIIELSRIDPLKPVHQITREERLRLVDLLKGMPFTIRRPRPIAEAIVTAGGVSTKELNPKTMESKKVPGMFFVGEMVDVDGYTGGFNLQIAFSMGFAAGDEAAKQMHLLL